MPDPRALIFARMVAEGMDDPEARVWIAAGMGTFMRAKCDVNLQSVLGLPPTASAAALAWRDLWLIEAARALGGDSCQWARACRLLRASTRLLAGLRTDEHPAVDDALRRAMEFGAALPRTEQGIARILRR